MRSKNVLDETCQVICDMCSMKVTICSRTGVGRLGSEMHNVFCQISIALAYRCDASVADQKAGHFGE
jgi:hypothetical protein